MTGSRIISREQTATALGMTPESLAQDAALMGLLEVRNGDQSGFERDAVERLLRQIPLPESEVAQRIRALPESTSSHFDSKPLLTQDQVLSVLNIDQAALHSLIARNIIRLINIGDSAFFPTITVYQLIATYNPEKGAGILSGVISRKQVRAIATSVRRDEGMLGFNLLSDSSLAGSELIDITSEADDTSLGLEILSSVALFEAAERPMQPEIDPSNPNRPLGGLTSDKLYEEWRKCRIDIPAQPKAEEAILNVLALLETGSSSILDRRVQVLAEFAKRFEALMVDLKDTQPKVLVAASNWIHKQLGNRKPSVSTFRIASASYKANMAKTALGTIAFDLLDSDETSDEFHANLLRGILAVWVHEERLSPHEQKRKWF